MQVIGFLRSTSSAELGAPRGRVSPRPDGGRLRRRARCRHRAALGGRAGDRLSALVADLDQPAGGGFILCRRTARREGCGDDHTRSCRDRHRPSPGRPGRQPQPTGRQLHRRDLHHQRAGDEAAGTAAPARAQGDDCCDARHAEWEEVRGRASRCSESGASTWTAAVVADATSRPEIEAACATAPQRRADAVLVGTGAHQFAWRGHRHARRTSFHPDDLFLARIRLDRWADRPMARNGRVYQQ